MSALKFIPGLVVVQCAAAALALVAVGGASGIGWALAAAIAAALTVVVGLWFGSIAEHVKKDALAEVRDDFARDRESLRVSAEAEKRQIVEESHQRIVEETRRAHSKANFKLGAAVTGMVGLAGILLYIELFTLALVTATTAGGALAGYLARARQEARALRGPPLKTLAKPAEMAEAELIERRPGKPLTRSIKQIS
ncbi:hypothetical protein [Methylotetracoccus oryzae]|uniref:hypothetical protein n=1 Tax=Methylotetracoccus oryzae TaxID=1919059 RepID=UPI00111B26DA|nr:hypothetical protein [Methylotetracoccus oryzae]